MPQGRPEQDRGGASEGARRYPAEERPGRPYVLQALQKSSTRKGQAGDCHGLPRSRSLCGPAIDGDLYRSQAVWNAGATKGLPTDYQQGVLLVYQQGYQPYG